MVDAYKVSTDLLLVKLDELFCKAELHDQAHLSQKDKDIVLVVGQSRSQIQELNLS